MVRDLRRARIEDARAHVYASQATQQHKRQLSANHEQRAAAVRSTRRRLGDLSRKSMAHSFLHATTPADHLPRWTLRVSGGLPLIRARASPYRVLLPEKAVHGLGLGEKLQQESSRNKEDGRQEVRGCGKGNPGRETQEYVRKGTHDGLKEQRKTASNICTRAVLRAPGLAFQVPSICLLPTARILSNHGAMTVRRPTKKWQKCGISIFNFNIKFN